MSETFGASVARVSTRVAGNAATAIGGGHDGHGTGVSIDYDATTGSYRVVDGSIERRFSPSDRTGDSDAVLTVYEQRAGNRIDELALFNPGARNTQLALRYVSYGAWSTAVEDATGIDVSQRYVVFGIRPAADAPSTGKGRYDTKVAGSWITADGLYELAGTSSLTADFGTLSVDTRLDLTGLSAAGDRTLGVFDGSGSIARLGGGFSGTFTHAGAGDDRGDRYSGGFAGSFFGPGGEEVGYSFSLRGTAGQAAGVVVGKGN